MSSSFISGEQASLQLLYLPLIKQNAYLLYQTILSLGVMKAKITNHKMIKKITGMSMDEIEEARIVLEQYLLCKTFYNENKKKYIYQLYSPMEANAFLKHEVFGRVYMHLMGSQVYEFQKITFAHDFNVKDDFKDITVPFIDVLEDKWQMKEEETFNRLKPSEDVLYTPDVPIAFNFDLFYQGFSSLVFPESQRNAENQKLIGELATIHGISEKDMRKLVGRSMDIQTNVLDKERLKTLARSREHKFVNRKVDNPYQLSPEQFLQRKQKGIPVTDLEKKLLQDLTTKYRMPTEVVNVLIEFALEKNEQRLTKGFVESIVASWIRQGINTCEKALAYKKNEIFKPKTYQKNKDLPEWYYKLSETKEENNTKKEKANMNEEELDKELEKEMAKLRGE